MRYNLELHPIAEAEAEAEEEEELWEAVDWYDEQKKQLGKSFAKALQQRMKELRKNPFLFPKIDAHHRKAVLKKFPYMIIYEVIDQNIHVLVKVQQ